MTTNTGSFPLKEDEIKALRIALGIIPEEIEGTKFCDVVRRKTIERRRISLVKHPPLEGQNKDMDLWQLCRYRTIHCDFNPIGWALRSRTTGDYYVYAEIW